MYLKYGYLNWSTPRNQESRWGLSEEYNFKAKGIVESWCYKSKISMNNGSGKIKCVEGDWKNSGGKETGKMTYTKNFVKSIFNIFICFTVINTIQMKKCFTGVTLLRGIMPFLYVIGYQQIFFSSWRMVSLKFLITEFS